LPFPYGHFSVGGFFSCSFSFRDAPLQPAQKVLLLQQKQPPRLPAHVTRVSPFFSSFVTLPFNVSFSRQDFPHRPPSLRVRSVSGLAHRSLSLSFGDMTLLDRCPSLPATPLTRPSPNHHDPRTHLFSPLPTPRGDVTVFLFFVFHTHAFLTIHCGRQALVPFFVSRHPFHLPTSVVTIEADLPPSPKESVPNPPAFLTFSS